LAIPLVIVVFFFLAWLFPFSFFVFHGYEPFLLSTVRFFPLFPLQHVLFKKDPGAWNYGLQLHTFFSCLDRGRCDFWSPPPPFHAKAFFPDFSFKVEQLPGPCGF